MAIDTAPLQQVDAWLDHFRGFWDQRIDSLATELPGGDDTNITRGGGDDTARPCESETEPDTPRRVGMLTRMSTP